MKYQTQIFKVSDLKNLFLNKQNPRHQPFEHLHEVIEYLIDKEDIRPLAKHIAERGLNPLDNLGVFLGSKGEMIVAEGNRRVSSILLLVDPQAAPTQQIPYFENLKKTHRDFLEQEVLVVIFDSKKDSDSWVQIMHDGPQGGIGRKQWSAESKARAFENNANALATRLIEIARESKLIPEVMKPSVSTVNRFVSKDFFRKSFLGITSGITEENVSYVISEREFLARLRHFIHDMSRKKDASGKSYSRYNKDAIFEYFNDLLNKTKLKPVPTGTTPKESLKTPPLPKTPFKTTTGRMPSKKLIRDVTQYPIPQTGLTHHVLDEMTKITSATPTAAAALARIFLEHLYRYCYKKFNLGAFPDQKTHTAIQKIHLHISNNYKDLDKPLNSSIEQLKILGSDNTKILSPSFLGSTIHGTAYIDWDTLTGNWYALEPSIIFILSLLADSSKTGQQ